MCGPNSLTGYNHVGELSKLPVKLAKEEESLVITSAVCNQIIEYWIIEVWNNLKEHARSPTKLWVNTMFGRTKGWLVCWSLTSLCHSNGHIETMPAREINHFTALTRIRSQFLRTQ